MPFSPADFTFCILQTAYLICKSLLFRWHKCEAFLLFSGNYFHVKYNTLYFISIKCVLCEAIGSASKTLHTDYQYAQNLRSEEHTSELQSRFDLVCRLLLEKKKKTKSSRE